MSTADAPRVRAPTMIGPPPHVLIVKAPYYQGVVQGLTTAAAEILAEAGASYQMLDVAGAFELPQAIRLALAHPRAYHGYVALGCVIRGETDHYDFICAATMNGLMQVALDHGLALGAGLLTVDNIAQATARSLPDSHNKGAEAAAACLRQINAARGHGADADG